MRSLRLTTGAWRIAVLTALVLCAQAFALTHEFNHDTGNETERCATCSIGGGLKHVAAANEPTIPDTSRAATAPSGGKALHAIDVRPRATARGPPEIS